MHHHYARYPGLAATPMAATLMLETAAPVASGVRVPLDVRVEDGKKLDIR